MLLEPKDRGAVLALVASDSLEHREAVVERVSEDVDASIRPVDELTVHPDFRAWFEHGGSRRTALRGVWPTTLDREKHYSSASEELSMKRNKCKDGLGVRGERSGAGTRKEWVNW